MATRKARNKNEDFEAHVPPHDIEAEKSVLGAILIDKDAIVKVVEFLKLQEIESFMLLVVTKMKMEKCQELS